MGCALRETHRGRSELASRDVKDPYSASAKFVEVIHDSSPLTKMIDELSVTIPFALEREGYC
jgi:hypothetical protein